MVGITIRTDVKDNISRRLQRITKRLPMHVMVIRQHAATIIKDSLRKTLTDMRGKEFKSVTRLVRGITIQNRADNIAEIYIQARGKPGTRGAEKLVRVLNTGTLKQHPIFLRKTQRVQSMMGSVQPSMPFSATAKTKGARAKGREPSMLTLKWDEPKPGSVPNLDPSDNMYYPYVTFRLRVLKHKVRGRRFFQKAMKDARPLVRKETGRLLHTLIKMENK